MVHILLITVEACIFLWHLIYFQKMLEPEDRGNIKAYGTKVTDAAIPSPGCSSKRH
jgi:hypothetical protein